MKKIFAIILTLSTLFALVSCGNTPASTTVTAEQATEATTEATVATTAEEAVVTPKEYEVKAVGIYREKDVVDKTIDIRFYNATPHVPYVSVAEFYKEFFKNELTVEKNNSVYRFLNKKDGYLKFDVQENEIGFFNIQTFSEHPDFKDENSKKYIIKLETTQTTAKEKLVDLDTYYMNIYGDGNEVYVPLALLSSFSGGNAGYNIAYNGKDIYVLDVRGQIAPEERGAGYFGESYLSDLIDLDTPRYEDLAKVNYGQLCFIFDNLRGYTAQLVFGDNNLLSLGLDGIFENYYPKLREMLLSTDKEEYIAGNIVLFAGLFDGGHTSIGGEVDNISTPNIINYLRLEENIGLVSEYASRLLSQLNRRSALMTLKKSVFEEYDPNDNPDVYVFDAKTKTAYICFDSFGIDYDGWDHYYNNGMNEDDIPTKNDTFSFIRRSFYRAVEDGAENVVIDLTTNGGGNTDVVCGIVGMLNGCKCDFSINDIVDKARCTDHFVLDFNLDGEFDEKDVEEIGKFSFNVGVLTSSFSFSCGNLLPCILSELGYAIIGERSGGGSCAVSFVTSADGVPFYHSSASCFSDAFGDNVDTGVTLDFEIESPENYYDFVTIAEFFAMLNAGK